MAKKATSKNSATQSSEKVVTLAAHAKKKETSSAKSSKPKAKTSAKPKTKAAPKKATAPKKSVKKTAAKKRTAAKSAPKKSTAAKAKSTVKKSVKPAAKSVKKTAPKAAKKIAKKSKTTTPKNKPAGQVGTAKNTAQISSMVETIKQMETYMPTTQPFKFDELAQEAANASRENVEAFIKSGTIFAKGLESWVKTATSLSQSAAEKQAQYMKEIMSSKTLNEAAEAQNKIAKANFDEFVSSATKLSEMGVKLLNDSAEPLNAQLNKTVQKASKVAA